MDVDRLKNKSTHKLTETSKSVFVNTILYRPLCEKTCLQKIAARYSLVYPGQLKRLARILIFWHVTF